MSIIEGGTPPAILELSPYAPTRSTIQEHHLTPKSFGKPKSIGGSAIISAWA